MEPEPGGVPDPEADEAVASLFRELLLPRLSLGPSGGLILDGRKASGGAGRDGCPLTFLWDSILLLGTLGNAPCVIAGLVPPIPPSPLGLTLLPVNFAVASSTGFGRGCCGIDCDCVCACCSACCACCCSCRSLKRRL